MIPVAIVVLPILGPPLRAILMFFDLGILEENFVNGIPDGFITSPIEMRIRSYTLLTLAKILRST
jgi:hypothetical protein